MTARDLLRTVHLWIGVGAAIFLIVLGLTGALLVFEGPLTDALNARLLRVTPRGQILPVPELVRRLEAAHPGYRVTRADFAQDAGHTDAVSLAAADTGKPALDLLVDPHDARVMGSGAEVRDWLRPIHQLHTRLLAGPVGQTIVAWAAVALTLLSLSGVVLWWPRKILRVRRATPYRRLLFDLHNAVGGVAWVFLLLFSLTGMVIHWTPAAMSWASRLTGAAPPAGFPREAPQCRSGAAPASLDRLYEAAEAAVAGARVTTVIVPDDVTRPARVILKFPEDGTPAGRTNVFLAACSGAVIEARSSRAATPAYRAVAMWNREIHTGDLWGWPTRLLACAASLVLPLMALTGPLIWWTKRRARSAVR